MSSKKQLDTHYHALTIVHDYNIDPTTRQLYLMAEEHTPDDGEPGVDFVMANRFVKNLNYLVTQDAGPILIHMKTCGGDWAEGMAIYDAIKQCPVPVAILSYTHARSMSSLVFQAADFRVMMPHSTFMFHEGTMAYEGTTKQFLTEAEQLKLTNNQMLDIYVDKVSKASGFKGMSPSKVRGWIKRQMDAKEDVYLNAQQTINLNLADAIIGKDVTPQAIVDEMLKRKF